MCEPKKNLTADILLAQQILTYVVVLPLWIRWRPWTSPNPTLCIAARVREVVKRAN